MSIAAKKRGFFKEYNKTEKHRLKVIKSNQNREVTEETKKKTSKTLTGFKHSEATKMKMKIAKLDNFLENPISYKNGKPRYPAAWELFKLEIRKRDNHQCVLCQSKLNIHGHHIDENKHNINPNNLITLCSKCHHIIHPKGFYKNTELVNKKIKIMKYKIKLYIKSLAIIKAKK